MEYEEALKAAEAGPVSAIAEALVLLGRVADALELIARKVGP